MKKKFICIVFILIACILLFIWFGPHFHAVVVIENATTYDLQFRINFINNRYLKGNTIFNVNAGEFVDFYLKFNASNDPNIVLINFEFVRSDGTVWKSNYWDLNSILYNIEVRDLHSGNIIKILYTENNIEIIKYRYYDLGTRYYDIKINNDMLE